MNDFSRLKYLRAKPQPFWAMLAILAAASPATAQDPGETATSIEITIAGFRSSKGVTRIVLCRPGTEFPDCGKAAVRTATVPITDRNAMVTFTDLPSGSYAVSVFHDANSNGKLDTFIGIPREGYGFSRNPPFRPRAPTFSETEIDLSGATQVLVSIRYLL